MYSAAARGDIDPKVVKEFSDATPNFKRLPEHVGDKKPGRKRAVAALRR